MLAGLGFGTAALAEPPPGPAPWRLEEALGLPERLSLSVDHRTRYEYIDNQFRAGRAGKDEILALRTRVRVGLRLTDWLRVGAEFQDSRAYLDDGDTPVDTSLVNAVELLQAYLELGFPDPWGLRHDVRAGRITMDVGSRRLVARNRYRNTSNAFTGFDWRASNRPGYELRAFFNFPVERKPNDSESLRDNEIEFDDNSTDFLFFGVFYQHELPWGDRGEIYAFGLFEDESFDPTDRVNVPRRRLATPGFRIYRTRREGRFDWEFETVLQAGDSRAAFRRGRGLDHFAHYHHAKIGYTFALPWTPRLVLQYDYASGDQDPEDGRNGRFDTLFGARRFEYGPTSIYGAVARANINTPGVRIEIRPERRWSGFVAYRPVWLASDRDEWVGSGVQDPDGDSGNFVGHQVELRVRWRPFPDNVLLEAGYAHLSAGRFIDEAPNSNRDDANYVYTQVILEF